MNATPNPSHQPRGVPRVSTMALILSVTEANVWPGANSGEPLHRLGLVRFGHRHLIVHGSDSVRCFKRVAGFGFRTRARYVVRGCVPISLSTP